MKPPHDKPASVDGRTTDADRKKQWQNPKLEFVEPKLHKRGNVKDVTGMAFFGAFSP